MNKKILALLAIFVLIAGASTVSAFDLNDIFGMFNGDKNVTTVSDVEFNIPEGFSEVTNQSIVDEPSDNPYVDYNISSKTFVDTNGSCIIISVSESDNITADDDMAKEASMGGANKTINGISGYESDDPDFDGFTYVKDGKLVIISVSDKELLKDIIIA